MLAVGAGASGKAILIGGLVRQLVSKFSTTLDTSSAEKPEDKNPESTTTNFLVFFTDCKISLI